ncbi:MAG TPA: bifunctional diguanylate cyclase/phosphodiesterase [Marinospirillum sp.]|uniref:putative bifunctional diguanylate cyclase/phosphodiesterase n=1 Tax=Marinospirillum sp. TaxID=2183934 RepID=UPI002B4A5DB4|nr:bifunctional diguanylate cyclase/phosphodiesterase [Marinospirillum sp.]HKM15373.1 bifunctional diguanylate cyclase/phosphodiesterase [Marinospirillum sp.]
MKALKSFKFLLLLPLIMVVIAAVALVYTSLERLEQQHDQAAQEQQQNLSIISNAAEFSRKLGNIQKRMNLALDGALAGELSELQLYRMHSGIVNDLASAAKAIDELSASQLVLDANHGSAKGLQNAFSEYKRFVIMSTDVLAVDPQVANTFLQKAQRHYLDFSIFISKVEFLLAEQTKLRNKEQANTFGQLVNRLFLFSFTALILLFGFSQFLSYRASCGLIDIAEGLALLSRSQTSRTPLPRIEALQQSGRGEMKRIAAKLLDFRHSLERQRVAEEEAFQLAFYDALTQLPNRRLVNERIHQALGECKRNEQQAALIVLDIDDFKVINEVRSYEVGDQVLLATSAHLTNLVTDADTVGRIGSNAFAILLLGMSSTNEAARKVQQLSEAIKNSFVEFILKDEQTFFLTASMGVTFFDSSLENVNEPLKEAEAAMYRAKKAGRGLLRYYDAQVQALQQEKLQLENDLRKALNNQEFQLYYQLQMNANEQPLGVEVLLRWKHPERGMVSPGEFIPLAESSDLILSIGQWVLETACDQLQAWKTTYPEFSMAVNVSVRQFRQADFVEQVKNALQRTQANPKLLKLELTESMVLDEVESTILKMEELRQLGIRFSIDDFGTGYSSLQYLKRLPLDQLKIDQSFTRDITFDKNDAAIVQTVIAMGQALELEVIAEGVETWEQQQILQHYGCNFYQGYLYGRPFPIEDLEVNLNKLLA